MNGSNEVKEFKAPKNKSKKSQKEVDKSSKTKRKRKWKDPDAPKRPLGAYFYYFKENNSRVKLEHPEFIQKEVVAKIAKDWKELSEEQKQPFVEKSNADKQRYVREKEAYDEQKRKEEEEAGNEENKYTNNRKDNKRTRTPGHGSYDKNGHKRSKHEIIFNVADEKEVRLRDIVPPDTWSFPSDSDELADWSPPNSVDEKRARIFAQGSEPVHAQEREREPQEVPVAHQPIMPPINENNLKEQQESKIFYYESFGYHYVLQRFILLFKIFTFENNVKSNLEIIS